MSLARFPASHARHLHRPLFRWTAAACCLSLSPPLLLAFSLYHSRSHSTPPHRPCAYHSPFDAARSLRTTSICVLHLLLEDESSRATGGRRAQHASRCPPQLPVQLCSPPPLVVSPVSRPKGALGSEPTGLALKLPLHRPRCLFDRSSARALIASPADAGRGPKQGPEHHPALAMIRSGGQTSETWRA